ncbi:MAG: sterol desaturase family protein [Polyangiaceae bacterium]|nr:sterol desaturase family protein [Polyangiaceae bacterium]
MSSLIWFAIPMFLATLIGEAWLRRRRKMGFDYKDGATSIGLGLGNLLINLAIQGGQLALSTALYELRIVDLGTGALVWLLLFFADDFVFYWAHRVSHVCRFFWATHEVHHSSEQFTLTTALRQPWTHLPLLVFWLPLPLLGFRPEMILAVHTLNLVYQYWIHTELIGRLGVLEWVLNTPSHHRVHHGSNARYLDKNYGGILIVWDRLFGTFQAEDEPVVYGLTKPLERRDIINVAFNEWIAIVRDVARARGLRQAARLVFGHPARLFAYRLEQEQVVKAALAVDADDRRSVGAHY